MIDRIIRIVGLLFSSIGFLVAIWLLWTSRGMGYLTGIIWCVAPCVILSMTLLFTSSLGILSSRSILVVLAIIQVPLIILYICTIRDSVEFAGFSVIAIFYTYLFICMFRIQRAKQLKNSVVYSWQRLTLSLHAILAIFTYGSLYFIISKSNSVVP